MWSAEKYNANMFPGNWVLWTLSVCMNVWTDYNMKESTSYAAFSNKDNDNPAV